MNDTRARLCAGQLPARARGAANDAVYQREALEELAVLMGVSAVYTNRRQIHLHGFLAGYPRHRSPVRSERVSQFPNSFLGQFHAV